LGENLNKAKELMNLDTNDYREMESIQDQVNELMEVWNDLYSVWTPIDQMGDTT